MEPERESHDRLERLVTRVLREQPLRRAPGTLESRVLAQVERRASRWWRRGFAHWPLPARLAFLAASAGFVKGALVVAAWLTMPFDAAHRLDLLPPQLAWLQSLAVVVAAVVQSVPSLWVHAGIALLALMYAALFGIGASAYRAVRLTHAS